MASGNSSGGGIGFFGLLAVVFITLRLCSVIDWSWWWVLAPLWIPLAVAAVAVVAFGCLALIFAVAENYETRNRISRRR